VPETRIRITTPEALDGIAADYVGTSGSELRSAILTLTGSSDPGITFTSAATANTGMKRDASARAQIADPSAALDIVNKQTLDAGLAGKVASTLLGAASGVATLDSSSKLTGTQVPTFLAQNLGTGTSFPSSPRRGDVFTHTGIGCLFTYDGATWAQSGRCTVASRTARDTLLSTWGASLPEGFTITQTDKLYRWRKATVGWVYAGWAGDSPWGTAVNSSTVARYTRVNQSVPHGSTDRLVTGWTLDTATGGHTTEPEWIAYNNTDGTWNLKDTAQVAIHLMTNTTGTAPGDSQLSLRVPGSTYAHPTGSLRDTRYRHSQVTINSVQQVLTYTGYTQPIEAARRAQVSINQQNTQGLSLNYQFQISFHLLPG
jgi:hypothetical protein